MEGIPLRAGGTIIPARFVKLDTAADNRVVQTSAGTDVVFGVAQENMRDTPGVRGSDTAIAAESGDFVRVHGVGEHCQLELGGSVTRGALLMSDSVGRGVTSATPGTDEVGAFALQSGSSGSKIDVMVICRKA